MIPLNMTSPKEHSKLPVTDRKETEIHELPDKELNTIALQMVRPRREGNQSIPLPKIIKSQRKTTKEKKTNKDL